MGTESNSKRIYLQRAEVPLADGTTRTPLPENAIGEAWKMRDIEHIAAIEALVAPVWKPQKPEHRS